MRSRALTAPAPCVLRYACQATGAPRPAAVAELLAICVGAGEAAVVGVALDTL